MAGTSPAMTPNFMLRYDRGPLALEGRALLAPSRRRPAPPERAFALTSSHADVSARRRTDFPSRCDVVGDHVPDRWALGVLTYAAPAGHHIIAARINCRSCGQQA